MNKIVTRLFTYALSLTILAISFFTVLYIKKYQIENFNPLDAQFKKYLSSILIFLVVFVVDELLHLCLRKISSREKYSTLSSFNSSVARRLTTAKWINSCLVLVLANYMIYKEDLKNKIDEQGGLIYDVFFIILGNSIVAPLLKLIDLSHLYRCYKKRTIRNLGVLSKMTQ